MATSVLHLPDVTEEQTLGDETAESILFRKMESVEKEIGDIRTNSAEILIRLDHLVEEQSDVKGLVEAVEAVMFGHKEPNSGLMTRLAILELNDQNRAKVEWNRTILIRCLWIAVAGLALEVVVRLFLAAG